MNNKLRKAAVVAYLMSNPITCLDGAEEIHV